MWKSYFYHLQIFQNFKCLPFAARSHMGSTANVTTREQKYQEMFAICSSFRLKTLSRLKTPCALTTSTLCLPGG